MSTATLTSKGQITIPLEIRNNLGLNKGDRLDFKISGQKQILIEARTIRTSEIYGILEKKTIRAPLSTEEIDSRMKIYFRKSFK